MFKKIIALFLFSFCFMPAVLATNTASEKGFNENLNIVANESEYAPIDNPQKKLAWYIGSLIAFGGLLGIFILIQITIAAYEYMTAQGNEEKVISAKKRIRNVVIAAVILVGGYLLAYLVINWGAEFTGYGT